MYCPKCGKENPDDAQLCHSCSSVLTSISTIAPASAAKTSGLAIASLVLGILSFCTFFITSIPAIILGIVGLLKIRKSGGKLKGNGFAIAGIVMALTIPILMIPILMHVRQIAHRLVCGTNMSLIGMELLVYTNDYDDFPTPSEWCDLLIKHAKVKPSTVKPSTLRCFGANEGPCNFAMNKNIEKHGLRSPPDMVVLFETYPGWNQSGGLEILTTDNHKGEGCNVLFMDSHVEFIKTEDLDDLKWKPE